jgi:sodium/potassium/calcium exchanger 6
MGSSELGGSAFVTVWFSSTLVLVTLAFVVQPIGCPTQFASSFILPSSPTMAAVSGGNFNSTFSPSNSPPLNGNGVTPLSPSFAAALQPAPSSKPSIFTGQRPRRCIFFALLAFVQCILWLNATAEEVVSIFEAIGRIWNVRRDTLGATVLAWGETVPDLVAVVSLAKAGQGTMAIAACFGGPVFNLLVSMGGPILIAGTRSGAIPYQMTSGVLVLVVSTVAVLVGLLVAVPLRYKWRLQRELGWVLLGVYAFSQVIFLLAEGIVL